MWLQTRANRMRQFLERDKIASRESFCRVQFENDWIVSWNKTEETNKRESFLKFIMRSGVVCTVERTAQASSSNCILQCYRKGNVCIVFTLIRFWTSRWFMQNNVERKVNEFVKVHEKKLKLKVFRRSYKLQSLAAKNKFLTPWNRSFGVPWCVSGNLLHLYTPNRL